MTSVERGHYSLTRHSRAHRPGERGTTIVEAAIFMVAFLMVLFGVMEAGRFLNVEQTLKNAAREGARFGVAPETAETCAGSNFDCLPTADEVEAVVQNYLISAAINVPDIDVAVAVCRNTTAPITLPADKTEPDPRCPNPLGPEPDRWYTRVIVDFPYRVLTLPYFSDLGITLQGESLMRNETSPD